MTSMIRNGGGLAPNGAAAVFYTVPALTDEKVKLRATNVSGADAYVYYDAVSPDGSQTIPIAFNGRVQAGDAVDVLPAGLELGAGWKLQHRASAASAIATFYAATPAT